jgi:hypothetical protein
MTGFPFAIAHPWIFAAALLLTLATVGAAIRRRPAINASTAALCAAGLVLLALSAGGLSWRRPATSQVHVMVDLSPSTRGAAYRDRAAFERRIKQLLPDAPYRLSYFSDRVTETAPGDAGTLSDLDSRETLFTPPPDAVAVVVFSDAQFGGPSGRTMPPVYVIADPKLDRPPDAAVTRIDQRDARAAAAAVTLRNAGPPRRLTFGGVTSDSTQQIEPTTDAGDVTIARPIAPGAAAVTARLDNATAKGDLWPENDTLSLPVLPPRATQKWFVSSGPAAPEGWLRLDPAALPTAAASYLAPQVIALDNLPASALSAAQLARIEQYVRDLGGGLIISGGDRAFAAGMYTGTALDALSPLATSPPQPTTHWILLADASGSMGRRVPGGAAAAEATTYWQVAAGALAALLPSLPAEDPVSVGSFSSDVRWWSTGRTARQSAALSLPPADVWPSGPTNLAAALDRVAREAPASLASELLVISDADVTIDEPAAIARRLADKRIRLHVLAVGDDDRARGGYQALAQIVKTTGGTILRQADVRRWSQDLRRLLEAAWPQRLVRSPATVEFLPDLSPLPPPPPRAVSPWNRVWLKDQATLLARSRPVAQEQEAPPSLGATWHYGAGTVAAAAFTPSADELAALARLVQRSPRDPRFKIAWDTAGPKVRLRIDAGGAAGPLNSLDLRLELWPADADARRTDGAASALLIPQTAPGRYELAIDAPQNRTFAAVQLITGAPAPVTRSTLDQTALPARYAREFDRIGNDYEAMTRLARRTGGDVISAAHTGPISLSFKRELDLSTWLAAAGATLLALATARWRWG